MYARLVQLVLGPDTKWEAERIADLVTLWLLPMPGFCGIEYLADYEVGEYLGISYWTTEEAFNESFQIIYPRLKELAGDQFQWGPSTQKFQVYVPSKDRCR